VAKKGFFPDLWNIMEEAHVKMRVFAGLFYNLYIRTFNELEKSNGGIVSISNFTSYI